MLNRLHYKNKNQHKGTRYHRHLDGIRRTTRHISNLIQNEWIPALSDPLMIDESTDKFDRSSDRLRHLCTNMRDNAETAFVSLSQHLLQPGYFLPYVTVMIACISRLNHMCTLWSSWIDQLMRPPIASVTVEKTTPIVVVDKIPFLPPRTLESSYTPSSKQKKLYKRKKPASDDIDALFDLL